MYVTRLILKRIECRKVYNDLITIFSEEFTQLEITQTLNIYLIDYYFYCYCKKVICSLFAPFLVNRN